MMCTAQRRSRHIESRGRTNERVLMSTFLSQFFYLSTPYIIRYGTLYLADYLRPMYIILKSIQAKKYNNMVSKRPPRTSNKLIYQTNLHFPEISHDHQTKSHAYTATCTDSKTITAARRGCPGRHNLTTHPPSTRNPPAPRQAAAPRLTGLAIVVPCLHACARPFNHSTRDTHHTRGGLRVLKFAYAMTLHKIRTMRIEHCSSILDVA